MTVRVSEADQAEVQKFFDAIYGKIRIAVDPEKPPRIVLARRLNTPYHHRVDRRKFWGLIRRPGYL